MSTDVAAAQAAWRARMKARLAARTAGERRDASAALREVLAAAACWREARTAAAYCARNDEPDLHPLLEQAVAEGRSLALPRWNAAAARYELALIRDFTAGCVPGRFGIPEPRPELPAVDVRSLDLALVPGVAFDVYGRRIGRGGGFYDRLLAGFAGIRCGVCFTEQLVSGLPALPHDVRMSYLATPAGVRKAAGPG